MSVPHFEEFDGRCDNLDFVPNGTAQERGDPDAGFILVEVGDGGGPSETQPSEAYWSPRSLGNSMHIWLKGFNGTWAAPNLTSYEYKMLSDGVYCTDPCRLEVTVQSLKRPVMIFLSIRRRRGIVEAAPRSALTGSPPGRSARLQHETWPLQRSLAGHLS